MTGKTMTFLASLLLRFDPRSAEVCLGLSALGLGASSLIFGYGGPILWGSAISLGIATQVSAYLGGASSRRLANVLNAGFWSFIATDMMQVDPRALVGVYVALAATASLVAIRSGHR